MLSRSFAIIFQVQEQVGHVSKDLLNYVLGAVPAINSLFVETGETYPITEVLRLKRLLDGDDRFSLAAPRALAERMGIEIRERLERWTASVDDSDDINESP